MKILLIVLFVTSSVSAKDLFGTPVSVKLDASPTDWKTVKSLLESKNANGRIIKGNDVTAVQFPFYLLFIANGLNLCGSSLLSSTLGIIVSKIWKKKIFFLFYEQEFYGPIVLLVNPTHLCTQLWLTPIDILLDNWSHWIQLFHKKCLYWILSWYSYGQAIRCCYN